MLFILVAALLLFGPRRLPELGRSLGKGLAEFKRASTELKRTLGAEMLEEELRQGREALAETQATLAANDPRKIVRDAVTGSDSRRVPRGVTRTPPEKPAPQPSAGDAAVADNGAPDAAASD